MENTTVLSHPLDHSNSKPRRVSARLAEGVRRPAACCRDNQHAAPAHPPKKRRRTSVARSAKPPADVPAPLNVLRKPRATISPEDLPVVSPLGPGPQPTAPDLPDQPLLISNRPVPEFQQLYHDTVDDMLGFPSGRLRPYSLALGRRIKQKLWERLDRPTLTETVDGDGRMHVNASYGEGVYPPMYDVDTSEEPEPQQKRAKR